MEIIDDFHSGEDCHCKKCREIIDAFAFTTQKAAGEDGIMEGSYPIPGDVNLHVVNNGNGALKKLWTNKIAGNISSCTF